MNQTNLARYDIYHARLVIDSRQEDGGDCKVFAASGVHEKLKVSIFPSFTTNTQLPPSEAMPIIRNRSSSSSLVQLNVLPLTYSPSGSMRKFPAASSCCHAWILAVVSRTPVGSVTTASEAKAATAALTSCALSAAMM